ncbi:MAG TPA: mechanosensitive ion channel domain-containing protein [Longimicrobiaceae bacterium]
MPRPIRRTRGPRARRRRGRGRSLTARSARAARGRAEARLKGFRQATILTVGVTGFLLLLLSPGEAGLAQEGTGAAAAAEEATGTLRSLWLGFRDNLPKYAIAAGILLAAGLLVRLIRLGLRLALRSWERSNAITALTGVVVWLVALGIAASVLVGDIRALVGSLGLVGLALSWALQTPIESFTGWLLNSFHGYYRVGDRIAVGEVFGDVYRIDFMTTTVWEYGSPGATAVTIRAEQPTGRLITFPNHEILTGPVVNYTRDFAYLWDELTVSVAAESDLRYAMDVVQRIALSVVGDYMREPARRYASLLKREGLERNVPAEPQVFLTITDWGANLNVRYLVEAREKRGWATQLALAVTTALNEPENRKRILPVYPRHQVQLIHSDGSPAG